MTTVRYICSLGTFCHTAAHLRRVGLHHCSFPFDSIYSSPIMVLHCLKDNFETFLDKSYHENRGDVLNRGADSSSHKIYETLTYGKTLDGLPHRHCTFIHVDVTADKGYSYYERCVNRFRVLLEKKESKLFIFCAQDVFYNKNEINDINTILSQKTSNHHILCISFFNDHYNHNSVEKDGNITYLTTYTYSRSSGLFESLYDNDYLHDILQSLYTLDIINDIH